MAAWPRTLSIFKYLIDVNSWNMTLEYLCSSSQLPVTSAQFRKIRKICGGKMWEIPRRYLQHGGTCVYGLYICFYPWLMILLIRNINSYPCTVRLDLKGTKAEFKAFEPRLKFKPWLKYGWFHLKSYSIFQDFNVTSMPQTQNFKREK